MEVETKAFSCAFGNTLPSGGSFFFKTTNGRRIGSTRTGGTEGSMEIFKFLKCNYVKEQTDKEICTNGGKF